MASGIHNGFKAEIMKKTIDLVNDTVNVALYDNSHSFVAATDAYATTNELATAGGYTQGGATLTTKAVTVDTGKGKWDADDISWVTSSFTAYFADIYDNTTATKWVIATLDFGGAQTVTSGTFTISFSSSGILTIT